MKHEDSQPFKAFSKAWVEGSDGSEDEYQNLPQERERSKGRSSPVVPDQG